MDNVWIAQVVVDQAAYHIDKPYDYLLPEFIDVNNLIGKRVLIPFGNGIGTRQGLVIGLSNSSEFPISKLKKVISLLDDEPVINDEMLKLALWLKEKTFCTYFDAIRVLLPTGISLKMQIRYSLSDFNSRLKPEEKVVTDFLSSKKEGVERDKLLKNLGLPLDSNILENMQRKGILVRNDVAIRRIKDPTVKMVRLISDELPSKLTSSQREVIELLQQVGASGVKELCYFTGVSQAVVKRLETKGIIEFYDVETHKTPCDSSVSVKKDINLTECQQNAYDKLCQEYKKGFSVNLLYGITGSGKTQVFLKVADSVVDSGKGVIIMVPEIALTPQTISIFNKRYGNRVAVFHSAMSLGQRMEEWRRVKNGDALIAVGTRSAVFAPFKDLGLVIIDEEQEHTYKSEQNPKFHARDVARFRAKYHNCMLILASATPSIESYTLALSGRYNLLKLDKRYGEAHLPEVTTVDMRAAFLSGNRSNLSEELKEALTQTISNKEQAILLMNRRGHNTYVSCGTCGEVETCPNCSISLNYHSANGRLMCHYCGFSLPYNGQCSKCGGTHMKHLGAGTQYIEEELKLMFPEAKILRMDADTTLRRNSYEEKLTAFSEGKYDIMLGTQMVAKGLDFPRVTLVGVLNADRSLYSSDFRSFERAFSLLTQVVGRSGRGGKGGRAIIQTVQPDNETIKLAALQDYDSFYKTEISTRKLMIYPPYCDLAMVVFTSEGRTTADNASKFFFETLVKRVETEFADVKLNVLGPSVAGVPKVGGKYRYRMLIKHVASKKFSNLLNDCILEFKKSSWNKSTTISVDINPENII